MNLSFRWPLLALAFAVPASAETLPEPGKLDSRLRVAAYQAEQVYRLPGYVGYQIHLEFAPGETFVGLGAGDLEALSFVAEGNHLFLKPKAPLVATNLTVLTNLRPYHFEYSASTRAPDPNREEVIYAVRFTYPPPPESVRTVQAALAAAPASRPRNFDYGYCGPSSLQPVAAFDDGVQTHLRFAPRADLPAIFVSGPDGSESLVNVSIEADEVLVHRIAERLILRRGRLAGCLVNRAYGGGGERLESGTLSPAVERRTKEVSP